MKIAESARSVRNWDSGRRSRQAGRAKKIKGVRPRALATGRLRIGLFPFPGPGVRRVQLGHLDIKDVEALAALHGGQRLLQDRLQQRAARRARELVGTLGRHPDESALFLSGEVFKANLGPGTVRRERRWWEGVRERGSWRWCDLGGQDVGKPRVTPDARKQRYETYDSSLFAVLTSQTLLWARAVVVVGGAAVVVFVRCPLQ